MTAGRSAGTEQGQGREWLDKAFADLRRWPCDSCGLPRSSPLHGNPFGSGHPFRPSPSVPPARDSGNGGALGQVTASRNAQSGRDEAPIDSPLIAGHAATGDQSGRDEAREAVARWLQQVYGQDVDPLDRHPSQWDADAEHLLAHPALRKLLRDGTTT